MRTMTFLALALGVSVTAWAASPSGEGATGTPQDPTTQDPKTGQMGQMGQMDANQMIRNWSEESRVAAQNMLDSYGQPMAMTEEFLVWHNNGPWKETIVYKEGLAHSFPKPHKDVIEQTVGMQVPVDMYDDLAKFDGSLIIDRTAGELSSRCNNESMNYLALNLANEIVTGKRTVEDARRYFAETANAYTSGVTDNEYTRGLMFETRKDATDKDRPFTGT